MGNLYKGMTPPNNPTQRMLDSMGGQPTIAEIEQESRREQLNVLERYNKQQAIDVVDNKGK